MEKGDKRKNFLTIDANVSSLQDSPLKEKKMKKAKKAPKAKKAMPEPKTEKAKKAKSEPKKEKVTPFISQNVNVIVGSNEKSKPIRKEISKQTTYLTLERPYQLTEEEEDKLSITKFLPIPPKDRKKKESIPVQELTPSSATLIPVVDNPVNEILKPNVQEVIPNVQEVIVTKPVKKAKKPVEIFVNKKEPKPTSKGRVQEEPKPTPKGRVQEEPKPTPKGRVQEEPLVPFKEGVQEEPLVPFPLSKEETKSALTRIIVDDILDDAITYIETTDRKQSDMGEIINIQNEPDLEEDFGLSSNEVLAYQEELSPRIQEENLIKRRKYLSDEEAKRAKNQQTIESNKRRKEEKIIEKKFENLTEKLLAREREKTQNKLDINFEEFVKSQPKDTFPSIEMSSEAYNPLTLQYIQADPTTFLTGDPDKFSTSNQLRSEEFLSSDFMPR